MLFRSVRSGLQLQVRVRREARMKALSMLAEKRQQVGRPVHWLDRAQAQARQICFAKNGRDQIDKVVRRRKVSAPAPEIDAGKNQFLAAFLAAVFRKAAHIFEARIQRDGSAGPARSRNHTERAAVIAAVLHLEVGPGLMGVCRKRQRSQI